jgi:hypothetical protein
MAKAATSNSVTKTKKIRKVHLTTDQIKDKIARIESKLKSTDGVENKKKRLNYFQTLSKLNKALESPETLTVDPIAKQERRARDQIRRAAKKMLKKKEEIRQKKQEKNKDRKKNCLFCKKCKLSRRPHNQRVSREGTVQHAVQHLLSVRRH